MNQSSSLFHLIHSLSRNEKRYFTVVAATHRHSSAYLKLFKAIDGQENYDEKALKKQFSNEPFIGHYSVIKVQLYHFLLKTLRSFHEGRSVDFQLKELMIDAALLNERALYSESRHKLNNARALAEENEDWKVLLEVLHKEYTIASLTSDPLKLEKELKRINSDEKKFISQLNNYGELAYLALSLTMMLKKYRSVRDKSRIASIRRVMAHRVLKKESMALSFRARSLFYYIWSSYLGGTYQFEKAEKYLLKHIDLYEKHPHFMQAAPGNYLGALRDLLTSRFRTGQYDEVLRFSQQLKKLPDSGQIQRINSRRFRMIIFSWTFKAEIGVAIKKGIIDNQLSSIQEQESLFYRSISSLEPGIRLETLLALASFYYYIPEHKKSVRLIEKMACDPAADQHHEFVIIGLFLQMLIHFGEGNFDVLDYLVAGLKRLGKQHDLSVTEKLMVEIAAKLSRGHQLKRQPDFFYSYYQKFSELKKDRFERHHFDYFDITLWLKQKMNRGAQPVER